MPIKIRTNAGFLLVFILAGSTAMADIPPLNESTASMESHTLPGHLVLLNVPDGSGHAFNQAVSDFDYSIQDAKITLLLLDNSRIPVPSFPAQDMWLETTYNGLVPCIDGTAADHPTLADGRTYWSQPLRAGGSDGGDPEIHTYVMVSGAPILDEDLPLWHNSPDINGDGLVNVADVQVFSVDYFAYAANQADYAFRSDLDYDGQVNVADIVPLAQGQGHGCP